MHPGAPDITRVLSVLGVNQKYGSWDRITVRDGTGGLPQSPTRLVMQESRTGRQSEAPGHIAPRKLDRGKPAFLADKATEVSVGMGAQLGAHSARTCSRRLSPAHLGTVLTSARTHSCRPPRSGNIPGGQGVAGSNPAVPTGQSIISNTETGL